MYFQEVISRWQRRENCATLKIRYIPEEEEIADKEIMELDDQKEVYGEEDVG